MSRMEREFQDRALRNGAVILNAGQQPDGIPMAFLAPLIDGNNWHPANVILKVGLHRDDQGKIHELYGVNIFGGASKRLELVRSLLGDMAQRVQIDDRPEASEQADNLTICRAFALADKILQMEEIAVAGERKKAAEEAEKAAVAEQSKIKEAA